MKRAKASSPEGEKIEGARARALRMAEVVRAKHAEEVVVLEVGAISALTDFFVICSASSEPQMQAILSAVRAAFPTEKSFAMEGAAGSSWVLMDYTDVILHVFKTEARAFYSLDRLWGDAPNILAQTLSPPTRAASKRARAVADVSG